MVLTHVYKASTGFSDCRRAMLGGVQKWSSATLGKAISVKGYRQKSDCTDLWKVKQAKGRRQMPLAFEKLGYEGKRKGTGYTTG